MRKLRKSLIAVILLLIAFTVEAEAGASKKELPFYFPEGVIQTVEPVKQLQEFMRYRAAMQYQAQVMRGDSRRLIPGSDSIAVITDIESTSSGNETVKMKLVLDHFVRLSDGRIRVTMLDKQIIITQHQLDVVKKDLIQVAEESADYNYQYYKDLADLAYEARAKSFGITKEELVKHLDDVDPVSGVTVREINSLPDTVKKSDFVPKELHFGYNTELPGILGVCWLNSGIIYYNPLARVRDYLTSKPNVLPHEMIHNNSHFQFVFVILSQAFDAELMASIPEMLEEGNKTDFSNHGYAENLRELAYIFFGIDFDQIRKEIIKYDLAGNIVLNEEKYNEHFRKVELVKQELRKFCKKIIAEYYSNPIWWSAFNDKLGDSSSVFRVMMAIYYDPTILGSRDETMKFIQLHEDEIQGMAEKAYKTSGEAEAKGEIPEVNKIPKMFLAQFENIFTKAEQKNIREYYSQRPDELKELIKSAKRAGPDGLA